MPEFNLQEEIQSLSDDPTLYQIDNEIDISQLSPQRINQVLEEAIDQVTQSTECITLPEVFDVYRSLLKHADIVPSPILSKLIDSLTSSLISETDQTILDLDHPSTGIDTHSRGGDGGREEEDHEQTILGHRRVLEMYAFLIFWVVKVGERLAGRKEVRGVGGEVDLGVVPGGGRTGGRGGKKQPTKKTNSASTASTSLNNQATWNWTAHLPGILQSMNKVLKVRTDRVWTTSVEREVFVECFTKSVWQMSETETRLKNQEIKTGIYRVICVAVKSHGHAFGAQTTIFQNLNYFEHLAEPMAELLTILDAEFDHKSTTEEVLREVANKRFQQSSTVVGDAKGPKSFSRFLVKLAELSPRLVQKQISLLLAHLDSEEYTMRMAIIEIIGILIQNIPMMGEGDEETKKKQIKAFFELLFERFLDNNGWVRSKLLATLIKICELRQPFPKERLKILNLTIRSLEDKTSSVRKASIQLLNTLLQTHIYGGIDGGPLNVTLIEERYEKLCARLKAIEAKEMEVARRNAGLDEDEAENMKSGRRRDRTPNEEMDVDDEAENVEEAIKMDDEGPTKGEDMPTPVDPTPATTSEDLIVSDEMAERMRATRKIYAEALYFVQQLENAVPTLKQLLTSKSKAEVLASMEFFQTAHHYQLHFADVGIKTMLHLIWSKDNNSTTEEGTELKGIRSQVIDVYKRLYFEVLADPNMTAQQQISRITKNMIERTYNATLAELTSLEELMRTMMAEHDNEGVHPDVINRLWHVYSTSKPIDKAQRRGAIIILGMLAIAKREIVTERVDTLLRIGLGPLGQEDLVLARYTCIALQRLSGSAKKVKGSLIDKTLRIPMDSPVFERLEKTIEGESKSSQWFAMAEQALNTIYLLGEQPDVLCSAIIHKLHTRVFDPPVRRADDEMSDVQVENDAEAEQPAESKRESPARGKDSSSEIGAIHLAQLVFVVGHVAIKHIVYLELVEREVKRQKDETSKGKVIDKDANDLEAVTGNAEDDIGDLVASVRERELLYGEGSLLAVYGGLIAHICSAPKAYKSPALREAAVLAMTKLMCVSAQYCEAHLPLLFKILETSRDPVVRSNIVIALGDIALCFSNMIDENSERLYQGLGDKDLVVKKNTLMVLTHLILNGMIKVKGQLGEMAKCTEDEEPRVSDLAKLFFDELSKKDNSLYNNLQDIISHLSVGQHAVDEEMFEKIMKTVFGYIEKEKQAESVIEKLCQRFRLADTERQWRDIAFCLSLLPFKSDRSVKKLIEGLPFYQDKLHEETVFKRFNEILVKARSNKLGANKPEAELKEFEMILAEHKVKGEEDQALAADAVKKTAKAARKRAGKPVPGSPVKRRPTRRRVVAQTDESAADEDEDDD